MTVTRRSTKNERIITTTKQHVPVGPRTGKTVLALDPGGSTGIALRLPDGTFHTVTLRDPGDIWELFTEPNTPDIVVFETFATGGRVDRYMIYTIELCGGIKAVCYALGIRCFPDPPQRRYPWMRQAESLLVGREHTKHEIDALAHLLGFEELHGDVYAS